MMTEPCPFCGKVVVSGIDNVQDDEYCPGEIFFLVCPHCACCGPLAKTKEGAVLKWNSRYSYSKEGREFVESVVKAHGGDA